MEEIKKSIQEEALPVGHGMSVSHQAPMMRLTRSGLDYIKGLLATGDLRNKAVARALLVSASAEMRAEVGEEEFQQLRKFLTLRDRTLYINNM